MERDRYTPLTVAVSPELAGNCKAQNAAPTEVLWPWHTGATLVHVSG